MCHGSWVNLNPFFDCRRTKKRILLYNDTKITLSSHNKTTKFVKNKDRKDRIDSGRNVKKNFDK